jgi:hypothetical protein
MLGNVCHNVTLGNVCHNAMLGNICHIATFGKVWRIATLGNVCFSHYDEWFLFLRLWCWNSLSQFESVLCS